MKILQPQADMAGFFGDLHSAGKCVLFLDYDGTLAPFRSERHEAVPYPGVREALDAIMENGRSRLVIISGRWTRDLLPLLQTKHPPEVWGSHGLERMRANGIYEMIRIDEKALHALAEADTWEEEVAALGGRYEQKPGCLAIHWRGLDAKGTRKIRDLIEERWSIMPDQGGLSLYEFDGGLELRAPGRDKGMAVNTVLDESGPGTVAAYLGDDSTDEDAFQEIKGKGLGILVRDEWRPTAAEVWLQPPEELLDFLESWFHARSGA